MRHIWRRLDDDRDVSAAYAARHPDAVYDAADPEWLDILIVEPEVTQDELDDVLDEMGVDDVVYDDRDDGISGDEYDDVSGDEYDEEEPEMALDELDWSDEDLYDDEDFYEVEIGIHYPDNV